MKRILFAFVVLLSLSVTAQQRMKNYDNILKSQNIYEIDAFLRDAHPDDPKRAILKPRLMELIKDYLKNASPYDQQVKPLQEKLALLKKRPSTKISFEEMNATIKQKQIAFYKAQLEAQKNGTFKAPVVVTKAEAQPAAAASTPGRSTAAAPRTSTAPRTSATPAASAPLGANTVVSTAVASEQEEFAMLMNVSTTEHRNKTVQVLNALFDNDPTSKETTVLIKNNSDCDIIVRMEGIGYAKFRLPVPSKGENTIVLPKGDYLFTSIVCGAQYASQKTLQKGMMVTLGNPATK